jgi:hypothetical protein
MFLMGKKFGQAQANMRLHHRKPMSNWLQPKCKICEAIIVFPLDQAALVQRKACLTYILQPPFMVDSPIFNILSGGPWLQELCVLFPAVPFPGKLKGVLPITLSQGLRDLKPQPFFKEFPFCKGFSIPLKVCLLQGLATLFQGLELALLQGLDLLQLFTLNLKL